MKFNSQICTTREQSEKLLALGLKKETADMGLIYITNDFDGKEIKPEFIGVSELWDCEERQTILFSRQKQIPAWSLHRLFELCGNIGYDWLFRSDDYFKNMVSCIEWMISKECFNKDYMEEKL